jgi:transcriptional regulator with XRE-family HTH domain
MIAVVNLRRELIIRKISPADFAKLMGVSHTWIAKLMNGDQKAGPKLQAKIDAFLATCWVCGKPWSGPAH